MSTDHKTMNACDTAYAIADCFASIQVAQCGHKVLFHWTLRMRDQSEATACHDCAVSRGWLTKSQIQIGDASVDRETQIGKLS